MQKNMQTTHPEKESHAYDDIIGMPHPVSSRYPQMTKAERASQFSAFEALSTFRAAIREESRKNSVNS